MTPLTIPFSSIIEGDRARALKKYGDLKGLISSIESLGTIQPIVLSKAEITDVNTNVSRTDYFLVAGGRRYRAMKKMGVETLHHGVTLDPQRLGFVFADEVPEHTRKEAELDENLHRLDMDWIDSCLLVADVHEAKKRAASSKWGLRQTAALLGPGYGKTNVGYAINISKLLRKNDKEIAACANMSDAIALMVKRQEEAALSELNKRAMEKLGKSKSVSTESFLDTINLKLGGDEPRTSVQPAGKVIQGVTVQSPAAAESNPPSAAKNEPVEIPLSQMFLHGPSVVADGTPSKGVLSTFPDASFSHIVTDIPYAIDMENLNAKTVSDVLAEHEVETNLALMLPFLRESFRLLQPRGFLVFFYDLDHHEKLQSWAKSVGFRVQRWPFVACKTSSCQNNAAQFNTTKNYEVAMFCRKDEQTVLRKTITSSWRSYDFASERKLYNNPFAKPFELWRDIYDTIAFQGQSVLDPFCGEMSACRAAVNCGLVPYGVELKEAHYLRGLENMKKVYALVHKSNCTFV